MVIIRVWTLVCVGQRTQKIQKDRGTNARDRLYVLVTMVSNDTLYS